MIHRYLGKKSGLMGPLLEEIAIHASPGDHVVDAFSGSLAVSLGMKSAGYRVTANDANLFSHVLANAYLLPTDVDPGADRWVPKRYRSEVIDDTRAVLTGLVADNEPGFSSLVDPGRLESYARATSPIMWLNRLLATDLPRAHRRSHFFDTYCEEGAHAAFRSSRGSTGRRRFLSGKNGARLDLAMNQVRAWREDGMIERDSGLILAAVMRGVERVANTQGTYHDFPRTTWDSRALNPIHFAPQPPDPIFGAELQHAAGRAEDTLDFIRTVDDHAVLYLDPPYNFRQYSAYYFLLNVIAGYPDLIEPDEYFDNVAFVRGQNPADDFSSSFCSAKLFLTDMATLIDRARADTVVISYFTGRNHWSAFDTGRSDTGRDLLETMLSGAMFEPGTLQTREVERRNYASYGGYSARNVHELIMTARKRVKESDVGTRSAHGGLSTVAS